MQDLTPIVTESVQQSIRYHETDTSGYFNEKVILFWFDSARTECFKKFTDLMNALRDGSIGLRTEQMSFEIAEPLLCQYDDGAITNTELYFIKDDKIRFNYNITDLNHGKILATGYTVHSFYEGDRKLNTKEIESRMEINK
jgi:acyl-CoA thioesterase FadM